jgi:hypothetical protein
MASWALSAATMFWLWLKRDAQCAGGSFSMTGFVANFRYRLFSTPRVRHLVPRSESGINDNSEGDAAGFGGYGNRCPGREQPG